MTADQRLDQLEPLVAQLMATVDYHTELIEQLLHLMTQRSEKIQPLLEKLKVYSIAAEYSEVTSGVGVEERANSIIHGTMAIKSEALDAKFESMDSKLDRILGMLGGSK